jgi:hypothetical protein
MLLHPSRIDDTRHAAAVIKLLITRRSRTWPATRFIVRADLGFCRGPLPNVGSAILRKARRVRVMSSDIQN